MINLDARQQPTAPDQEAPLKPQVNGGRGRGGARDSAASGGDGEEREGKDLVQLGHGEPGIQEDCGEEQEAHGSPLAHNPRVQRYLHSSEDGCNVLFFHLEALDWPRGDICCILSFIQATR